MMRFCLRRSIKLQDILEMCKVVLVELAQAEAQQGSEAISASRISVMSGVHRRDVARLVKHKEVKNESSDVPSRVLGQWQSDKRFLTKGGAPRVLHVEGKQSEFSHLVSSVSQDVNPYTVLFELERIGAVERTSSGLKLCSKVFLPSGNEKAILRLLTADVEDLVAAVEENIEQSDAGKKESELPNLHLKTQYDNVPHDAMPKIREWFIKEGSAFHKRAREFLAQFDKDINRYQAAKKGRSRVCLGTFSRIEKLTHEDERAE